MIRIKSILKKLNLLLCIYILYDSLTFYQYPSIYGTGDSVLFWTLFIAITEIILLVLCNWLLTYFFDFEKDLKLDKDIILILAILIIFGYLKIKFNLQLSQDVSSTNQAVVESLLRKNKLLSFIQVGIIAPIIEELFFRKFFMRATSILLNKKELSKISVLLSTILFSSIHLYGGFSLGYLFSIVAVSFLLSVSYYLNKTITINIMFHMFLNITSAFLL